ncbi:MAG: hypothetical protein KF914_19210 [Rhizobiaceae bacterium]|nr:hypothetical protein [Rhizobiaceae bacterium]
MHASFVPALLLSLIPTPILADIAAPPVVATVEAERHFTTNALDGPVAVSDWYTLLRGTLVHDAALDGGRLRIEARLEATRYDDTDIEDDRSGQVSVELLRKLTPSVEAKATVSLAASDVGDDITIGQTVIGTRVRKLIPGGVLQLGADLGDGATLVATASAGSEQAGRTRIDGLSGSYRIEPDRLQADASLKYARTLGRLRYGGLVAARHLRPEHIGFPPSALGANMFGAQIEGAASAKDGATLQVAAGVQFLDGEFGIYRKARLAYEISGLMPIGKTFALRGGTFARFETADTDDPLASWLRRLQVEATLRAAEPLLLAAGLYREVKQNVLLENRENGAGAYAEATCDLGDAGTLAMRIDWSRTHRTVIEERYDTVDVKLAYRKKL